jgi:hypothetical protein
VAWPVTSPYAIRQKHIRWLVRYWVEDRKLNVGTVELRLTHLRAFMSWMGKANMVGRIDDYTARPEGYVRGYVAEKIGPGKARGSMLWRRLPRLR